MAERCSGVISLLSVEAEDPMVMVIVWQFVSVEEGCVLQ